MMGNLIIINGVIANEMDVARLNNDIIYNGINFTVRKDWFGNQHITTFN